MIAFVVFATIVAIFVLELISIRVSRRITATCEVDLSLCAPGEEIALRYTVSNASFMPVLFVGVSIYFEGPVTICESEKWKKLYARDDYSGVYVDRKLFIRPPRKVTDRVRFAYNKRGLYGIGKVYLETGDFLGFKSNVRSWETDEMIVCTAPLVESTPEFKPLGGLLGEISVLRFMHEDPCLITGYREYTGREPMKQISWLQTAKTSSLMVKQQDHTADADVLVLVDLSAGQIPVMERCLAITRTICEHLEDVKVSYSMITNGDLGVSTKGLGRGHLFPILRAIGLSRMTAYTSFNDAVERCIAEKHPDRTFLVISPRIDETLLRKLQTHSEHRIVLFTGEEAFTV